MPLCHKKKQGCQHLQDIFLLEKQKMKKKDNVGNKRIKIGQVSCREIIKKTLERKKKTFKKHIT